MDILTLNQQDIRELQRQCLHHNIFPIDLSYCAFTNSPEPVSRLLKPLLDECIENLQILNTDELSTLLDPMPPGIRSGIGKIDTPPSQQQYRRIANQYITMLVQRCYSPLRDVIHIDPNSSSVLLECPELKNCFDDDGLLILNNEFTLLPGGIKYRGKILHYHQFLRRAFSAEPNFDFLERFADHSRITNNQCRIAIDHRRIMSEKEYRQIMEYDHWYGHLLFDTSRIDDLNYVGVTVKRREHPSPFDSNYVLDRTEIYWKSDRSTSVKTLEIEEIASIKDNHEGWHINRYIHSERDTTNKTLRHFDGAVKLYSSDNYRDRHNTTMPSHAKANHYIKMFRIDGNIDLNEWVALLSFYFRGNEMITEYFDPQTFDQEFRPVIEQYKNSTNTAC
jgi:hypothetical protein